MHQGPDGWVVAPGAGLRVDLHGPHELEVLVRGQDVEQAMGAFVFTHAPIVENPPHAHLHFAKIAYVLEGEYEFRVGGAEFLGRPGTTVVIPKGAEHTFTTASGGRLLFVCSPSGNEEMFVQMSALGPGATPQQLADLDREFGTAHSVPDEGSAWHAVRAEEQ